MFYAVFVFLNNLLMSKVYADDLGGNLGRLLASGEGQGEGAMISFVQAFLEFAVPFGVFCALVLLGYAAFMMITSTGDPEKLKEAREVATNAIIGAVMVGMGVIIMTIIAEKLVIPGM